MFSCNKARVFGTPQAVPVLYLAPGQKEHVAVVFLLFAFAEIETNPRLFQVKLYLPCRCPDVIAADKMPARRFPRNT